MRKQITSLLLTLAMLLSLVPTLGVTASAAETEWTTVSTFDELYTAVNNKQKNIKLGQNISTSSLNSGVGMLRKDILIFTGENTVLDLNGNTLNLNSRLNDVYFFICLEGGSLTIKDSSPAKNGKISGSFGSTAGGKFYRLISVGQNGSLTLEGGTFSVNGSPYPSTTNTIYCGKGSVTVKDGVTISQPEFFDRGYAWDLDGDGYALITEGRSKAIIEGGTFDGGVKLTGYQDTNGSVQINGGTFKNVVQLMYAATEDNPNPAVIVNDGTFENNVYLQGWPWRTSLYMPHRLNGGTIYGSLDLCADDYITDKDKPEGNLNIAFGLEKCFGYNAVSKHDGVFTGSNIHNAIDWKTIKQEYRTDYYMVLKGDKSNPIRIIPNAWGMKSVTLDGKKIDYFKDWKGTVERMDNSTAHTLKFEWYPLASELVNAGYTYRAKCEHYISGSTAVQQTDTIAADKTSHTVTIPAGADTKVYSYDLQLNLDKNGSSVGIFSNQHIVKLVVSEAPVVDTRTSIESVTLKVPKLKEGAASGDNFTLSGTNTGVSTINTVWEGIPASGAVAGNFYAARITLTAKDGYAFNTNTQVKLNGDYLSTGSGINNGGAGMTIYVNVLVRHEHNFGTWQIAGTGNVHFRKCSCGVQEEKPHEWKYLEGQDKYKCTVCGYEIDGEKERITYVYASPRSPIAGEHPGDYTPAEWVKIGGANYKVESIVWKNMDDTDVTTFEAGKIYKGTVTFKADTGFAFDGDRIYSNKIFNSSNAEVVGNYTLADGGTTLTATFKLKDENVVRPGLKAKVKLPTLSDKVGQSLPAAKLVDTTLPENVALVYSVYEDNLLSEEITDPDYKVKPNQKYIYAVWLKHGDSTDITEITKTYNVSYEVTDGGDTETYTDLVGYGVLAMYQTPDTSKINSVALTVTAPKYGEAPATTATGANDTRYTVGTPTWSPAVTDGKFGANTYTVSIPVTAASGYSFDENGIYTINGYVATYADGKVSYTFPQLIAPHTHDTDAQPWVYMDPGTHIKTCTAGDDFKVEAHTFSAWTKVDESTHSRTCSKCKKSGEATNYTETAKHTWVWVVDKEAALNQPGKQHEECTGCHAKRSENTEIPALRDYAVTVTGGTATVAAGTSITRAMEGVEVTVTADAPKTGRVFDKWVVKAGGVTLANETSATTTFTMPGNDVKIEATYKDAPPSHSVYVGMTYTAGNFIYQITSIDTATLGKSKVIGVVAAKKNKITKVTIPDRADCKGYRLNVTAVGDKAFKSMKKLKKVTFGSNVKVIGKNAFSNCKKLDKISFKNVTTIGNDAFAGCKALKKLTIGNKVTVIGKNAFKNCSKLETVVIGKAVKTISSKAFIGDNKIKKITFKGDKLKTVKKNAFSKKAKKNIKSKKTKLKGNKKAIKLFKKKLKIK